MSERNVARLVAETLRDAGADICFGVTGTGNLKICAHLDELGVRFIAARHECNAAAMAEGYAKSTGRLALASVHCGPGLTNSITAMAEAAKARTPIVLVAGDVPEADTLSNFRIDQDGLARSVGLTVERVHSPETAEEDVWRACSSAMRDRRAVVLNVPVDIQDAPAPARSRRARADLDISTPLVPSPDEIGLLADLLHRADRPIIVGGYGAVLANAGGSLRRLAEECGALLGTSARGHGLFGGDCANIGVMGGFGTPIGKELYRRADLIIGFGISFTRWTLQNRALLAPNCKLVQINSEPSSLSVHCSPDAAFVGDARSTAEAVLQAAEGMKLARPKAWRSADALARIERQSPRNTICPDLSTDEAIDPRKLTSLLNDLLPKERVVTTDSGHSQGWPIHYMDIPDSSAWGLSISFGSNGLGLGTAIGLAMARPDRVAICCVGDGGFMMSIGDLETAVRLNLRMCVVVYNDSCYAAEVHYYEGTGYDTSIAEFTDTDFAQLARSVGAQGVTVRTEADLEPVRDWAADGCQGVLLIDAKVLRDTPAQWFTEMLEEMRR